MQTPAPSFSAWLKDRLAERGWQPADLTRASASADYPKGFDSALLHRWLLPPPHSVVPDTVKSLTRLAYALRIPETEVYEAAGLRPSSVPPSPVQTELQARLNYLGATLSKYPRAVWLAIIEANERMTDALLAYQPAPPVSDLESGAVSEPNGVVTPTHPPRRKRLTGRQPLVVADLAYA